LSALKIVSFSDFAAILKFESDHAALTARWSSQRHCERSDAIQEATQTELDCFRLRSSSFGGRGRRKGSSR
jgi:hypothetical protein